MRIHKYTSTYSASSSAVVLYLKPSLARRSNWASDYELMGQDPNQDICVHHCLIGGSSHSFGAGFCLFFRWNADKIPSPYFTRFKAPLSVNIPSQAPYKVSGMATEWGAWSSHSRKQVPNPMTHTYKNSLCRLSNAPLMGVFLWDIYIYVYSLCVFWSVVHFFPSLLDETSKQAGPTPPTFSTPFLGG